MSYLLNNHKKFYLLYEGEGEEETKEGENKENENKEGEGDSSKKSFTQEEVNKMVATERRKNEEKTKKIIGELETLKKSKNLTEQEQQHLSKRIEELQDQLLTKEQLSQKDKEKLQKEYTSTISQLETERDNWKSRFEKALVINAIHKASEEHEALDTSQIIALIQVQSPRVVQELDENGAPKDSFVPRVKMQDTDTKTGKEVTLDLTISEAVKRMKEKAENFNLFKSTVNGGLGLGSGAGRSDSDAPPIHDPAAYRKWRQKHIK